MMRRHVASVVLAVLLVATVAAAPLAGSVAAQSTPADSTPTPEASPTPTPSPSSGGGDDAVEVGSGADGNETNTSDSPTTADSLRVSPASFSKDWARIETIEEDKQFNVTGTYAVFATNVDVDTARVNQPNGEARVMDGDRTVEVEFSEDAAPGTSSYYEVELFFEDGSSHTLALNVKNTDLQISTVDMRAAADLAERLKSDAAANGYNVDERGLAAVEEYYTDTKETAELLSNIFGPALKDLQVALIAAAASALFIILLMFGIIFFLRRLKKGHSWKLEALVNSPNLSEIKRRAMAIAREEDRQAAAEYPLNEVPEIGRDFVYWANGHNVYTVKQLADLFHFGEPRFEDGEIVRDGDGRVVLEHEGIDELIHAEQIRNTWLEPVIRDEMLSEEDAIAHGKKALDLMASKFNEPAYRSSRMKTRQLLSNLSDGTSYSFGRGDTGTAGRFNTGAGADD
jgi:hypothetical protein